MSTYPSHVVHVNATACSTGFVRLGARRIRVACRLLELDVHRAAQLLAAAAGYYIMHTEQLCTSTNILLVVQKCSSVLVVLRVQQYSSAVSSQGTLFHVKPKTAGGAAYFCRFGYEL